MEAILHRQQPSYTSLLLSSPYKTLAKTLYDTRLPPTKSKLISSKPIRIVCISDTHNNHPTNIPPGDILIHAGDLTNSGSYKEVQASLDWLDSLPHKYQHKIIIAGNHDLILDPDKPNPDSDKLHLLNFHSLTYLCKSNISISITHNDDNNKQTHHHPITIHGNPQTRKHGNWAFEYPSPTPPPSSPTLSPRLSPITPPPPSSSNSHSSPSPSSSPSPWPQTIPSKTTILLTHQHPFAHLDSNLSGSKSLLHTLRKIKPRLHIFGHNHSGYGIEYLSHDLFENIYDSVMIASNYHANNKNNNNNNNNKNKSNDQKKIKDQKKLKPKIKTIIIMNAVRGLLYITLIFTIWLLEHIKLLKRRQLQTTLINAALLKGNFGGKEELREAIVVEI